MAVKGKTILQATERTELTGEEGIPFQEGAKNGHVLLENVRRFVMGGLFETDQFDAPIFVLPKGGKLMTWVDDAAQIPLAFYKEYDNGDKQVEVGSPQRHLNLNSSDMVTVELPGGKKESLLTMSQLGTATEEKDGLMPKEDKKAFDSIRSSEDENSIWFNGKKYGATLFKNLFGLSTSSSNEEIKTALGGNTYNDISQMVDRGILFLNINNRALQHVMIRIENKGSSEGDYLHIQGLSDTSDTAYIKIRHYSGSFNVPGAVQRNNIIFKTDIVNGFAPMSDKPLSANIGKMLYDEKLDKKDVVNNLTSTDTTKALSAAMGKELNDKIEAIKSEISALRDEIEALKGSGA